MGLVIISISNKPQLLVISVFSSRNHDGTTLNGDGPHLFRHHCQAGAQDRPTAQVSICWIIQMHPWSPEAKPQAKYQSIQESQWQTDPQSFPCAEPQSVRKSQLSLGVWIWMYEEATEDQNEWGKLAELGLLVPLWHLEQKPIEINMWRCKMM